MKLKAIELNGFKSFADKTVIDIKDGINTIVGPNGSGKSNIIEAIRWVMGEQSAKDLRGNKMTDVIFAGTEKRKSLNRCKVSMIFDNSDQYLDIEFKDLEISRTLYRDGSSKYQINGNDCRLKDIQNLFMDTGLGQNSFSIISQGNVDEIVSMSVDNRRLLIEELAGVHKYKKDKLLAQKELDQTTDNLIRLSDIMQEIDSRIEPLEKQAATAKKHLALKEEEKALDSNIVAFQINELKEKQIKSQQSAQNTLQLLSKVNQEINLSKEKITSLTEQTKQLEETRESIRNEIIACNNKLSKLNSEKTLIKKENEFKQTSELKQELEKQELEQKIVELKSQLTEENNKLNELAITTKQIEELLTTKKAAKEKLKQSDLNQQIEDLREEYIANTQEIVRLETLLESKFKAEKEQKAAKSASKNDLIAKQDIVDQLNNDLEKISQAQEVSKTKETSLRKQLTSEKEKLKALTSKQKESKTNWYNILDQQERSKRLIERLQKSQNESYNFAVKTLLEQKASFPQIIDSVAGVIEVADKYELAITTALGAALQNIIIENDQASKEIVAYLKQEKTGRVTLLPLNTIKAKTTKTNDLDKLKNNPAFIGIANSLVATDSKYQEIIDYFLAKILIVKDYQSALKLAKEINYRYKLVSLDGQVINAGGSLTVGSQKKQIDLLEIKNEIALEKEKLEQIRVQQLSFEKELKALNEEVKAQEALIVSLEEEEKSLKEDKLTQKLRMQELAQKQKLALQEVSLLKEKIGQVFDEKEVEELKLAIQTKKKFQEELLDKTSDLKNVAYELGQQKEAVDTEITALNLKLTEYNAQVTYQEKEIEQIKFALQTAEKNYAQLNELAQNEKFDFSAEIKKIDDEIVSSQNKLTELQQTDKDNLLLLTENKDQLDQVRTALVDLESKKNNLLANQKLQANKLQQIESQIRQKEDYLKNTYQIDKLSGLENFALEESLAELKQIKMDLQKLGPVNLEAIDEYQEVFERKQFMTEQIEDLQKSKEQLDNTISNLDKEVEVKFKQAYVKLNAAFKQVFSEVFSGGYASLELTDKDNLLTTGINIVAQAPGKKLQQLSLMSGGEKALTAIALLMAILKVKPIPFIILDEVEAALDEANVDRLADYLAHYAKDSQFIVITHRQGTMFKSDNLYGVTMQSPGVSTIVTVDLASV